MRLRRNSNDSQPAGPPGDRPVSGPPTGSGGSTGHLVAPDRNAIRSVGVAILPGLPLPEWATAAPSPQATWAAPAAAPYADPRAAAAVPPSPQLPAAMTEDPALTALATPASPLPPPDPAQWSERPAGPVVWGPAAPSRVQAPPAAAPPAPPAGTPWFTPETAPPPATSPAGQYGWLVQPDAPVASQAPAAAPVSGSPLPPPSGPPMAPPAAEAAEQTTWNPAPANEPPRSALGLPEQVGPEQAVESPRPSDPWSLSPASPTSTTAPIGWVRADAPIATPASARAPMSAEPVLEPVGVAVPGRPDPAQPQALAAAPAPAAAPTPSPDAWALAAPAPAPTAARAAPPAPQPAAPQFPALQAMPIPTGRPVPLPPPSGAHPISPQPAGGWAAPGDGPQFATPPSGAWAPPGGGPRFDATAVEGQPESGGGESTQGRRLGRILLAVLAVLAVLGVAYVLLFVTPGFLRSDAGAPVRPVLQTPETVAGLAKTAPAQASTIYLQRVAEATASGATSQYATYADPGRVATVWVTSADGGSPASTAEVFRSVGGPQLGSLESVSAGPRGGVMSCAAATPTRTLCFWNADGVRGAADVRGLGRGSAAALVAQMRVGLEQVPA